MRKVGIIGAAIILASSIGVVFAQERAPQHVGYGTGVGDSQGVGDRSRVMDAGDFGRYIQNFQSNALEMVPGGRVELPLSLKNRILSPARLPVPPSGRLCNLTSTLLKRFLP